MGTLYIVVRILHVLAGALWVGGMFFAAWFVMPAIIEAGPAGGQVMMGVQRRGLTAVLPSIAGLTVLAGIWLYRPYMGGTGPAALAFGYGGAVGLLALILGASVVGRSLNKAMALGTKAMSMAEGPERGALMKEAGALRQRALTFARIVSILTIITALVMTIASHYL
jgi:uncharacterized membrane protein